MIKVEPIEGFSCVEMKNKCQEAIRKETANMSDAEKIEYINRKAHEGELGRWLAERKAHKQAA